MMVGNRTYILDLSKIQLFLNYSQVTISFHHHGYAIPLLCVRIAGNSHQYSLNRKSKKYYYE